MPLPRIRRIRRTSEYSRVRAEGKSCPGRLLVLAFIPLPGEPHCRFGCTITRKIGNAVTRNKPRRRLSAIAHSMLEEMSSPHLVVAIPRHGAPGAEFEALKAEWIRLARKAGLLRRPPAPEAATP